MPTLRRTDDAVPGREAGMPRPALGFGVQCLRVPTARCTPTQGEAEDMDWSEKVLRVSGKGDHR